VFSGGIDRISREGIMNWRWSGTPGMDLHEALRAACKFVEVHSYLEIGVDGGGSLNTVLNCRVPELIVLCDIWDPEYCDHGDAKSRVKEILEFFHATAVFLDGDSKVTVPTIQDQFDLVLVDGDHSAEGALADLINAWPLVKTGGILVMDDIRHLNYPWLGGIWESNLLRWNVERIFEEHGSCNADMVIKR
jgi:cephalosporin hydroxylase